MRLWLLSARFWLLIVVALTFLRHGGSSDVEFEFTTDLTTMLSTRLPETTTGDDEEVTTERSLTDATTDVPFFVDDILIVAPTGVCLVTAFWRQPILPDLTFVASSHQPQTSQFGIGKAEVVYLFADMLGNFHCVTFIVEVVPESPILVNDIVKVVPDGVPYGRVNWKGPYFPDLWLVSSSHQPVASLFDLGVTEVIYVFANSAGDFFCVTFLVEVSPESPLLVDDIVVSAPIGGDYVTVNWKGPFLPRKTLVSSSHQPNTSPFCIGVTKVVYVFVNPTTGEFCCVCFYVQVISDLETTERVETTTSFEITTIDNDLCCPVGTTAIGDNCFAIITEQETYDNAVISCSQLGGDLARVNPPAEVNQFIVDFFNGDGSQVFSLWIGLRRTPGDPDRYFWESDGTELLVTEAFWASQQPAAAVGFDCAIAVNSPGIEGSWFLNNCVTQSAYLCQHAMQLECDEFQHRGLQNDGKSSSCENANPCLGSHVTCMDDSEDTYCVCDSGYQFVDSSQWECADVNECLRGLDDCEPSSHLICINEEGSYSCQCLDGYTMTAGGTCEIGNVTVNSEFEPHVPILLAFRTTAINQQTAVFSTELLNETSDKFKLMASFTCSSVMEAFSGISTVPVKSCSALGFRSGSVRVYLQLDIAETTLSTESIKETFMSKLYDDSNGFKVLERTNGDSLIIEGSSVKFEYINDISCDDIVCHNGGVCQVDQKIYERGCICPPNLTGSHCETDLTNSTLKVTESTLTTQKKEDSVSLVTQERRVSAIFIVIPIAFTACLMFLLMCCCCISLKHKTDRKTALVKQRHPIDVIPLHRMNTFHRKPEVIRNPGVGINESYEETELEDERRLKHFERIFTEMRKSGRHSVPPNANEDRSVSSARLSEFSHPYTADGSVNF